MRLMERKRAIVKLLLLVLYLLRQVQIRWWLTEIGKSVAMVITTWMMMMMMMTGNLFGRSAET